MEDVEAQLRKALKNQQDIDSSLIEAAIVCLRNGDIEGACDREFQVFLNCDIIGRFATEQEEGVSTGWSFPGTTLREDLK